MSVPSVASDPSLMSLLRPEALFGRGNSSASGDAAADNSFAQMVETSSADPAPRSPKPDRSDETTAADEPGEPNRRSDRSRPLRGSDRAADARQAADGRSRDTAIDTDETAAEAGPDTKPAPKPRPKDGASATADETAATTADSDERVTAATDDAAAGATGDTNAVQAVVVPPPVVPQAPTTAPVFGLGLAAATDPSATAEIGAASAATSGAAAAEPAAATTAAAATASDAGGTTGATGAETAAAGSNSAAGAETAAATTLPSKAGTAGKAGAEGAEASGPDTSANAATVTPDGGGETAGTDAKAPAPATSAATASGQSDRPIAAPSTDVAPPARDHRMFAAGRGQTDLDAVTGLGAPAAGPLPAPTMWGLTQAQASTDAGAAVPIAGLAVEIAARAKDGSNRFEIRLDPPELGRIDVRLHVDKDGQVTSHLVVERAETLDLLKRDAPQLERALQQAGLKTSEGGLEFSLRDQSFAGRDQGGRDDGDRAARVVVPDDELAPVEATRTPYGRLLGSSGGVDIRV